MSFETPNQFYWSSSLRQLISGSVSGLIVLWIFFNIFWLLSSVDSPRLYTHAHINLSIPFRFTSIAITSSKNWKDGRLMVFYVTEFFTYIIEPLPLFCITFSCAIISYSGITNSSICMILEKFLGRTSFTIITSGLYSLIINRSSGILLVNVSAFSRTQFSWFNVQIASYLVFCPDLIYVSVYLLLELYGYFYLRMCVLLSYFEAFYFHIPWGGLSLWIREWWSFFYFSLASCTSNLMVLRPLSDRS